MIFLLGLLLVSSPLWSKNFSAGYRTSCFFQQEVCDNSYLLINPSYHFEKISDEIMLKANLDVRIFDPLSHSTDLFIDPIQASLHLATNKNTFELGFLRYRFSETFGLQLLDIANPRDYSEFIFNDLSWSKRSVFGVNHLYHLSKYQIDIQTILTLWPNGDRFPVRNSPFDLNLPSFQGGIIHRPWFQDFEYGIRLRKLFDNGLDLSFLFFHHFIRPTPLELKSPIKVDLNNDQVNSLGGAGSYVLQDWVFRGDVLYTFNDIQTLFSQESLRRRHHLQFLMGADRTLDDFLMGFQTQHDLSWHKNFLGWQTQWNRYEIWQPSFFLFNEVNKSQFWLQLKNNFTFHDFETSIVFDFFKASHEGLFSPYKKLNRILFDIQYLY